MKSYFLIYSRYKEGKAITTRATPDCYYGHLQRTGQWHSKRFFLEKQMWNCDRLSQPHHQISAIRLTVNKAANAFVENRYNDWFSDQVARQLKSGNGQTNIKVSSKLSDLKPLHASWIVDLYKHIARRWWTNSEGIWRGWYLWGYQWCSRNFKKSGQSVQSIKTCC